MSQFNAAPLFPEEVVFPDVDAATLAQEEIATKQARVLLGGQSAWHAYLRKTLPPVPPSGRTPAASQSTQ